MVKNELLPRERYEVSLYTDIRQYIINEEKLLTHRKN